jgi:hypothetical protein
VEPVPAEVQNEHGDDRAKAGERAQHGRHVAGGEYRIFI